MGEHVDITELELEQSGGKENETLDKLQKEVMKELAEGAVAGGAAAGVGLFANALREKIEKGEPGEEAGPRNGEKTDDSIMGRLKDSIIDFDKHVFRSREGSEASDKDKDTANEMVEKEISHLIPKGDRQTLQQMTQAIINEDLKSLQNAIKTLGPDRVGKFVEEVERILQDAGDEKLDVHITTNKDGNVVLYSKGNNAAVEIDSDGKASVRAVSFKKDGNVVLEPGEVLNAKPAQVMEKIGDQAVYDMLHGHDISWIDKIEPLMKPEPMFKPTPFWGGPFIKPKDLGFDGQRLKELYNQIDKGAVLNGIEAGARMASPAGGIMFDAARGAFSSAVENLKGVSEKKK